MAGPLDEVRAVARRIFRSQQAADAFLRLPSPRLGGAAPVDLVRDGRADEVLKFLENLEREAPAPPPGLQGLFSSWLGRFGGGR